MQITSKSNEEYKRIKKLITKSDELIFIEGKKLVEEALQHSLIFEEIIIDKTIVDPSKLSLKDNVKITSLDKELISSLFTTNNKPTGGELLCAFAKRPQWKIHDLIKTKLNLIYLENIQDPGNLGAIFRSALAFNAGGILLSSNSVDVFNTKVIRASAGAVFKLPFFCIANTKELLKLKQENKYNIYATTLKSKNDIYLIKNPAIIMFGNEGQGLTDEAISIADDKVKINHSKNVESLNLSNSCSIVLHKLFELKENI